MQLTNRERSFIIAGGVLLVIMLSFYGFRVLNKKVEALNTELEEARNMGATLQNLGQEYQLLKSFKQGGAGQNLNNMMPAIEAQLQNLQLRETASIVPSENAIEENFQKKTVSITLKEAPARAVLQFIQQVESQSNSLYKIEHFSARPLRKPQGMYSFSIKIAAFEKKTPG